MTMTSPTQRAGADVRRWALNFSPHRVARMIEHALGQFVSYDDYAALQARIAELEAGIQRRDDDVIVPLALYDEINRVGYEWQQRAEAAEARNAASERDAGRYRWLRNDSDQRLCVRAEGHNPVHPHLWAYYITSGERLDAAIDAHAQGQAGEEKDERG